MSAIASLQWEISFSKTAISEWSCVFERSESSSFSRISSMRISAACILFRSCSSSASRREISASTASYSFVLISILSDRSESRCFKSSSCLTQTVMSSSFFFSESSINCAAFSDWIRRGSTRLSSSPRMSRSLKIFSCAAASRLSASAFL